MGNDKIIRDMIRKCSIYYDDLLISSEDIIKKYMHFFSMQFDASKKTTSFVFHTCSPCFDMVSLAILVLVCFSYDPSSNDELLKSLKEGDMVLFKGERYRWNGLTTMKLPGISHPVDTIVLSQDPKGKNGGSTRYILYESNKHMVRPYLGDSVITDGRGIREQKSNRTEFLSHILGIDETEVPSTLNISIVIIADKSVFVDMCHRLRISYNKDKIIHLTDIVPVSYFTSSGEEIQIGKNPTKADAVIKVVSKVSTARDIVLDKHGNKVVGVMATNVDIITSASEFKDLIRRKSLNFAIIITPYNAEICNMVIEQYEDASIFACTKEELSSVSTEIVAYNKFTKELNQQLCSIVGREMNFWLVDGCWNWNEYKQIKHLIYAIRELNRVEEEKETFIKSSLGLMNLFTSAFFPIAILEDAIRCSKINSAVASPVERINELFSIAQQHYISKKEPYMGVAQALLDMYKNMESESSKEKALLNILSENRGKKIAIVFPKAYYSDIFSYYYNAEGEYNNVFCTTANRFDISDYFDLIIVVGDIVGKKFDPIQCFSASKIIVLLYECEVKMFRYRKNQYAKIEKKINARIRGLSGPDYEREMSVVDNDIIEDLSDETIREHIDLDNFINRAGIFDIQRIITSGSNRTNTGTAEVNYVGTFVTGEQILFSKYYDAVLYNRATQKVTESKPEKLSPGDVLVFAKRDQYTKNIVDMILDQLIKTKKVSIHLQEAVYNSLYWKTALSKYKECNKLTYREISNELRKYGSALQEATIRQWLDDDNHIVGPRNVNTMEMIAKLTNDDYLLANFKRVFDDCRIVRYYRRNILSLIAQAISDKLCNKTPEPGSIFEVVFEHVDKLSETKELEYVYKLEETAIVINSLVNRPITEMEVSL